VTLGLNCLLLQPEHVQIHGRRVKLMSAEEHLQPSSLDSDSGSRKVVLYLRTVSESTVGEGGPLLASASGPTVPAWWSQPPAARQQCVHCAAATG
jgi:hypothetical protein